MQKIKVAVLRGGPSSEYEVSLKTGKSVLDSLPPGFVPTDVFITRSGEWLSDGAAADPHAVVGKTDVVFNALHGEYGEDGKVQQLLDALQARYTGSGALASAVAMNKVMAKELFMSAGLKTPVFKVFKWLDVRHDTVRKIFTTFPMPAVVKPNGSGSSVGVSIVRTMKEINHAMAKAFEHADTVVIEEFIEGAEATCGVIEDFRGEKLYALPLVEIRKPAGKTFFDYEAKYGGGTEEICPGNFSKKASEAIADAAKRAHRALGLRHYSRSDFIIHPKRGVYILETNTLPGLTKESLLPKSLAAVGVSLPQFLEHIIGLAMRRK
ncbi:MAG: D-alanine--D-alanine ligase [Patescibacteria group bacterium]|nr:D-alanine--D-alanine ligase [Patescibacteria group bacterium]MDE1945882.1 D-alanine--D-alanine ligase [Patescibacteria group bacterium]